MQLTVSGWSGMQCLICSFDRMYFYAKATTLHELLPSMTVVTDHDAPSPH